MIPLFAGLGTSELLIILAVVLLLFGGSRLAGLGKSTGRALKEFKEETKGLRTDEKPADQQPPAVGPAAGPSTAVPADPQWSQPPVAEPNPAEPDRRKDV
jgi:sec-independent protein translocase protein TatA